MKAYTKSLLSDFDLCLPGGGKTSPEAAPRNFWFLSVALKCLWINWRGLSCINRSKGPVGERWEFCVCCLDQSTLGTLCTGLSSMLYTQPDCCLHSFFKDHVFRGIDFIFIYILKKTYSVVCMVWLYQLFSSVLPLPCGHLNFPGALDLPMMQHLRCEDQDHQHNPALAPRPVPVLTH